MLLRTGLVLALCLTTAGHVAQAQGQTPPRLPPVDQATSVPDFFSFRARLQAAVARHDGAAVLAALGKDVELSFGGEHGIEDFKAMWKPDTADSLLWDTLATVLSLGGSFDGHGRFLAPYVTSTWPRGSDIYTAVAAVGSSVNVRAAASDTAPVVANLDFSIVDTADQSGEPTSWVGVKLPSGQVGHVRSTQVRSPIDYRIGFSQVQGRWQIDYFLAGD
ncbi:hypothetical protein [Roseateles sp.]|uniref:hypothetical protein n=1 Tax=Roseateles sp. TaxID=1971397 RepID=UPI003BAD13CD